MIPEPFAYAIAAATIAALLAPLWWRRPRRVRRLPWDIHDGGGDGGV